MKLGCVVIYMVLCLCDALDECNRCECCKLGRSYCIYYNNVQDYCHGGCKDGFFGQRCTHACIPNCLTCTDQYSCQKCKDGFYGARCSTCPSTCLNCSNYSHCHECKDGFYNGKYLDNDHYKDYNDCRHRCKNNCTSCISYNTCNVCSEGFYNGRQYIQSSHEYYDCRHTCSNNCKSCSSYYTCNTCKNGFYTIPYRHDGVEYRNCPYQCHIACKSCLSQADCTECKEGYYYSNKYCFKCPKDCVSCTTYKNCKTCVDGKYNGQFSDCRETCSQNCETCFSLNQCTKCVQGKYGHLCNDSCNHGCKGDQCQANGYCMCKSGFTGNKCDSCVYNKYGVNCDIPCPKGCKNDECHGNGTCYYCDDGFVGDQCNDCEVGKYGTSCEENCPIGCESNKCSRNGICNSCKAGKYGERCTWPCSEGCSSDNCSITGDCFGCKERFSGMKCNKCRNGLFGDHCNESCPSTCSVCSSLTNCSACVDNHWGNTCQKCPTHCQNCSMEGTCTSCDNGFYGLTCNEQCNKNCLDSQCDQFTASCSKGCLTGFYGSICDMKCSPNCVDSICKQMQGECLKGCEIGFNGTTCNQTLPLKREGDKGVYITAGTSAGGGLLLLVVIITIIVILIKRRRPERTEIKVNNLETETMTYSEIKDGNVAVGSSYNNIHRTDEENMAYSSINEEFESVKNEENIGDALYAKPIKQKKKAQRLESTTDSSTVVIVNNPSYEKPVKSLDQPESKIKTNESPSSSQPIQMQNNNTTRKSVTKSEALKSLCDDSDVALEIEEDIESLISRTKSVIQEDNVQKAAVYDMADIYYNVGAVNRRKIRLEQLDEFVAKKTKADFTDEFKTLPAMLIKPYTDSQKRANISKNRYKGIYPYDDTRVVLKDGDTDYINASYIDGYNKSKAYIASIGPTTRYMGDMSAFWIMVWQEKVGKIVMLTRLLEGEVPKCDKYWPEKGSSLMFADIQVTCKIVEEYADYTYRSFIIHKGSVKRTVIQVHFTAWPDKGIPDDVTCLVEFREKVNNTKTDLNGPVLVHCSAGIGRTGTYIALDSVTKEGEAEGEVDIYAFVRNMREQRVNMIQTAGQYEYLHHAIVHTLTTNSKPVKASDFDDYMESHDDDHLGKMFEKFQTSIEQRSDDENEAVKRNKALKNKNRDGVDIPGDRNRPRLNMYIAKKAGSSDFINAIYVNSFKNVNRYLLAQTPLPETVEEFLALIIQEKVSCIVSIENRSSVDKDIGIYCPADNHTLKKGAFTVKTERGQSTGQYLLRHMKISHSSKFGSEDVTVPHVQFTNWDNDTLTPGDAAKFVQFIRDIELKFGGEDTKRPILVHCSTGASRSGLFCVVSILLEKIQIDQEVSVVNTVRQIKYRRHMAIPNKEQYIFCHQCVNEYLRTFETYSNFELKH